MAFRLRKIEALGAGLKRICLDELEHTGAVLLGAGHDPVLLHDARKQLKKVRAALDLGAPVFGRLAKSESAALAQAARSLAYHRETDALVALLEREARIAGSTEFDFLETSLRLHQIAHRSYGDRRQDIEAAHRIVMAVRDRLSALEVPEPAEGLFLRRFRKRYKAAREAAAQIAARPNEESVHEFRKLGKRLLNQARLLASRGGDRFGAFNNKLVRIDDLLGRSRDCANLAAILRGVPAAEAPLRHGLGLRVRLEQVSDDTRDEAAKLGRRLYRRSSRAFMKKVFTG